MRVFRIFLLAGGLTTGIIGSFACEERRDRMTPEQLQAFEEKQQGELTEQRQELEAKRERQAASADKKIDQIEGRIEHERAERPDKAEKKLDQLRADMNRDDPSGTRTGTTASRTAPL